MIKILLIISKHFNKSYINATINKDMKTTVFYYSGTGNSLFVAKNLASSLEGQCINISKYLSSSIQAIDSDVLGFVIPCYAYTYPKILNKIIEKISFSKNPKYVFVIITYGSSFSRAGIKFIKKLKKIGLKTVYFRGIIMPENYIAIFRPDQKSVIDQKLTNAKQKIQEIANDIKNEVYYIEKHNKFLDYIKTSVVGTIFNGFLPFSHFFFKNKDCCSSCGICTKVCPTHNVVLKKGKPKWHNHCTQCMACLNWCPQKCIDYTPLTKRRERYTNPEIDFRELI